MLNYRNNQGHWNVDPALLDTPLQQVCESETAITPANLFSCPHERWLALDLDDESWMTYSKFTLRLSWPASVRFTSSPPNPNPSSQLFNRAITITVPRGFFARIIQSAGDLRPLA